MAHPSPASRRVANHRNDASDASQPGRGKKRKSGEAFGGSHKSQSRSAVESQRLKARTKRLSRHIITTKWRPLAAPAQDKVRALLKAAKRPVVLSRRDEGHRREAESVLDSMVERLEKRLPQMPFPPNSREEHFDLDRLVERNRLLESQLTPAMHSIELLKDEISKEEWALERDRETLERLERDSRAEQRERERQAIRTHPLLETQVDCEQEEDYSAEKINLRRGRVQASVDLDNIKELEPLLNQFRDHLESMRANAEQMAGVEEAMGRAGAALDDGFRGRLDEGQHATTFGSTGWSA